MTTYVFSGQVPRYRYLVPGVEVGGPAQLLAPVLAEGGAAGQAGQVRVVGRHQHHTLSPHRLNHNLKTVRTAAASRVVKIC